MAALGPHRYFTAARRIRIFDPFAAADNAARREIRPLNDFAELRTVAVSGLSIN